MAKLRIAIVGPGLIGKKHLRLVHDEPDSCVSAIVVPNRAKYAALATQYQVPLYQDVETMLASETTDGAIISSPNVFHVEQAIACLRARVPVLVEKPIAHHFEAARGLVDFADQAGVPLLVGHHRAHSPIMRAAQEIIREGRLGRIVAVMGSALFYKPNEYFEAGPWRKEIGGGPILINLIHEIGNLRALCGEISGVQAISSSATRGFAVEDTASLNLEFVNGALGVFILSDTAACARSWEQTARENPSYPSYDEEDCYVISGTLGTLSVPTMRLKFYPEGTEPSWWKPFSLAHHDVAREDPLKCQLRNFLNVIKGTDAPVVSGFDGLQNLRVIEAIFRSIERRTVVQL